MKKKIKAHAKSAIEIKDYDQADTTSWIDRSKQLKYEELGLKLPDLPPTQVVSIRLPSGLLNELRALGSQKDIPYQGLIKLFLSQSVERFKKSA